MKDSGHCDLSFIEDFFRTVGSERNSLFVIKSTIPIGTIIELCKMRRDLRIIHNPEFLTARTAYEDFHSQKHKLHYIVCHIQELIYLFGEIGKRHSL